MSIFDRFNLRAAASVPANAPTPAQATQAEISAVAEIAELCTIAGHPEAFAEFVAEHKTPAAVRAELVASVAGLAKPWGEVLESLGLKRKEAE